jgi:hypothetical protein
MTSKRLTEIIIEEAQYYLAMSKLNIASASFDSANKNILLNAAQSVNGKAAFAAASEPQELEKLNGSDILFVDYLPLPIAAEIALGLTLSPFGKLAFNLLSCGKTIIALFGAPESQNLKGAYRSLYECYWNRLAAFGVIYLGVACAGQSKNGACAGQDKQTNAGGKVYRGKVLSRQDLLHYGGEGKIVIGKDVIVTSLALDIARDKNIQIIRTK